MYCHRAVEVVVLVTTEVLIKFVFNGHNSEKRVLNGGFFFKVYWVVIFSKPCFQTLTKMKTE